MSRGLALWLLLMAGILTFAQPYEGRRMYSIEELKRHQWVDLRQQEEGLYSKWVMRFTDTEVVSDHSYRYRDPKTQSYQTKAYTVRSPYYLADGKAGHFDYSKVGKVKKGTYVINGSHNKQRASQFVSQEIIQLNDRELTLYWCVPEGNIGGCDTVTWVNEQRLGKASATIKRP